MTNSKNTEKTEKVERAEEKGKGKVDQIVQKVKALLPESKEQKLARKREEATRMDEEAIYINGVADNAPTQWKKGGGDVHNDTLRQRSPRTVTGGGGAVKSTSHGVSSHSSLYNVIQRCSDHNAQPLCTICTLSISSLAPHSPHLHLHLKHQQASNSTIQLRDQNPNQDNNQDTHSMSSPSTYLTCPFCGSKSRQGWKLNISCPNLSCPGHSSVTGAIPLLYNNEAKKNKLAPFTKANQELLKEYRLEHGQRVDVHTPQEKQERGRAHLYNRGNAAHGSEIGLQAVVGPARMMANSLGFRTSSNGAQSHQPNEESKNKG